MGLRRLAVVPCHLGPGNGVRAVCVADTYTEQVAGKFQAQTHVVADPARETPFAEPRRNQPAGLDQPVDVESPPSDMGAAVAPDQTGRTTPGCHPRHHLGRDPRFSGVILVIDSRGYHVRAYDVRR